MILSFNSDFDRLASYVGSSGVGTLHGHPHLPLLGLHWVGASSFTSGSSTLQIDVEEHGSRSGNVELTSPNFRQASLESSS